MCASPLTKKYGDFKKMSAYSGNTQLATGRKAELEIADALPKRIVLIFLDQDRHDVSLLDERVCVFLAAVAAADENLSGSTGVQPSVESEANDPVTAMKREWRR